jgi:predicted dehydrogenase
MGIRKIRLAVVGTGRIAQAHLNAVRERDRDVELVAVCDADRERAEQTARIRGAGKVYEDYRALAADPDVEAAVVCLPNHLHHPAVLALAEGGKHILVEKPMAMNVREADQMIASAEQHRVTLMVGQSRRFFRSSRLVWERLGDIAPVFRIQISFLVRFPSPQTDWWADRRKAGPLVIPLQGSHSLDTIVWLLDKLPATVYARSNLHNPQFGTADETSLVLGFDSGEIASVQLSLNTEPYVHETLIIGDGGTLRLDEQPTEKVYGFRARVTLNGQTIFDEEETPSPYAIQLSEFMAAVREGREPDASGRDVRRTMQALDAACESSETGRVVRLK